MYHEDRIKYVTVEFALNTKKFNKQDSPTLSNKIECGLLKGLKVTLADEEKDEVSIFITILKNGKTDRIVNLKYFSILTIEIYNGIAKEIIFYSDEHQDAAFGKLIDIMESLRTQDMLTDNESIIDISKYEDIPKNFKDRNSTPDTTTNIYKKENGGVLTNAVIKSRASKCFRSIEPTMLMFKRRSKKPTKEILKTMKHKILQIASGDYKPPPFKKIKGEKKDTETINKKEVMNREDSWRSLHENNRK